MLYNEERPHRFDDVVGQDVIVENIRNQSKKNKFFQVYIFGGKYGSGKTTMARIVALAANCKHKDENGNPCLECEDCRSILNDNCIDVVEIDGASNNGIDQIRELTANTAYVPALLKYKVIIIDEVHMLSKAAFNAFLKTLEEPPEYCIFILCTTEVNAIPATVRSRSAKYSFRHISVEDICCHIEHVAKKHSMEIDIDARKIIAQNADGSMRNALALLEQCAVVSEHITADVIKNLLGIESSESCFELLNALAVRDTVKVVQMTESFYASGRNMSVIINDMLEIVSDTIMHLSGAEKSIINTDSYIFSIKNLSSSATLDEFFTLSSMLSKLKNSLKTDDRKSSVTVEFVKITKHLNVDYDTLLARVSALEKEVAELKENGCTAITVENTVENANTNEKNNAVFIPETAEDDILPDVPTNDNEAFLSLSNIGLDDDEAFEYYVGTAAIDTIDTCDEKADKYGENSDEPEDDDEAFEYYVDTAAIDTIDTCDEKAGKYGKNSDEPEDENTFGFDYMSIFDEKPSESPKGDKKEIESNKAYSVQNCQTALDALETLKSDHAISAAIEKNCKAEKNSDGSIVLYTAHAPVQTIVQAYINARHIDNIKIVLDTEKAL